MDSDSKTLIALNTSGNSFLIDSEAIASLIRVIGSGLGVETYELSWDFIDDEAMQALNRQYREKNQTTDVLSFPQQEWEVPLSFRAPVWPLAEPQDESMTDQPPETLGDVVISPSEALKNARSIGHGLDREVCFLLVHGILHLCGHDHLDPVEEAAMTAQQQAIMKYLEEIDGVPLWAQCAWLEV